MKEIKAIMQPFLISKVVEALKSIPGLPGVTVSDVRGFGRAQAVGAVNTVAEGAVEYVKKSKLEVVVPDEMAESVVDAIQRTAHTGNPGDGKIFVYQVDDVVRIRTGEHGNRAISCQHRLLTTKTRLMGGDPQEAARPQARVRTNREDERQRCNDNEQPRHVARPRLCFVADARGLVDAQVWNMASSQPPRSPRSAPRRKRGSCSWSLFHTASLAIEATAWRST